VRSKFTSGNQEDAAAKSDEVDYSKYFIASARWSPSGDSSGVDTSILERNGGKLPFWELVLLANEGVTNPAQSSPSLVFLVRKREGSNEVFIFYQREEAYWDALRLLEDKNANKTADSTR
jgi:hypothetical protein